MTIRNHIHLKPGSGYGMPRAYKQGDLDSLCGVYGIVNACRYACRSKGIHLDGEELFVCLIEALDSLKKVKEALYDGIGMRDMNFLFDVTKRHLLDKADLDFRVERPLLKIPEYDASLAFAIVRSHLRLPGASALMDFEMTNRRHYTVIRDVKRSRVRFSDSAPTRPERISDFELKKRNARPRRSTIWFTRTGIVLIQVSRRGRAT